MKHDKCTIVGPCNNQKEYQKEFDDYKMTPDAKCGFCNTNLMQILEELSADLGISTDDLLGKDDEEVDEDTITIYH